MHMSEKEKKSNRNKTKGLQVQRIYGLCAPKPPPVPFCLKSLINACPFLML